MLPGTGGLTRLADKRKVRRDLADAFSTLAEGVRGRRAVQWGLVDGLAPPSRFEALVAERAAALESPARADVGIRLEPLEPEESADRVAYRHVRLELDREARVADLVVSASDADRWHLRMARELDDALLRLRFNEPEIGVVRIATEGDPDAVREADARLCRAEGTWLADETRWKLARVLRRLDQTARSFFAIGAPGAVFCGSLAELLLAADRSWLCDDPDRPAAVELTEMNYGAFPMGNGLSRLRTRFLGDPDRAERLCGRYPAAEAEREGLATFAPDDLDWDDEIRVAVEERAGLSPDALTGMESSLRFAGPETLETKIFGRLSAWQNWIFQRPNAVGERGALASYGRPAAARFDWTRT